MVGLLGVSEELNSVETLEDRMKMKKNKIRFQKNLIVWKRAFLSDRYRPMDKFQKNLIVWKHKVWDFIQGKILEVSEGLNSVETPNRSYSFSIFAFSFRRT